MAIPANRIVDCAVKAAEVSVVISLVAYLLAMLMVWRVRRWMQRSFPDDWQSRELTESEQQSRDQLQQEFQTSDPVLLVAQFACLLCHLMGLIVMGLIRRLTFKGIEGTYEGWPLFLSDLVGWWTVIFVVLLLQRA